MLCAQRIVRVVTFHATGKHAVQIATKKLYICRGWPGQSDLFIIHAVHANRALLPSKP